MPENQEPKTPSVLKIIAIADSRQSMEFNIINFMIKLPLSKKPITRTKFDSILIIIN